MDETIKSWGECIYKAAADLKGQEIRALDLTQTESYADFVFIISGSSHRQVQAISDRIREDMAKIMKARPLGIEGYETGEWVLVDFGDIVVHVFLDEKRPEYKLEEMWPHVNTVNDKNIPTFLKKRSGGTPPKAVAPKKEKVAKKPKNPTKTASKPSKGVKKKSVTAKVKAVKKAKASPAKKK